MSVPEGKRTKSKFEVIVKARNIVVHTIKITSNEKVFPKRYRWSFTGKLVDETVDMYKNLFFANSIRVVTKEDKNLRRQYQVKALAQRSEEHTSELQSRDSISYAVFCLKKFFFNDTATTEIYTSGNTLSLHDALPI